MSQITELPALGTKVTAFQDDGTPYVIGTYLRSHQNPVSGRTTHYIAPEGDPHGEDNPFATPARIAPWNGEKTPAAETCCRIQLDRQVTRSEVLDRLQRFDRVFLNGTEVFDSVTDEDIAALQKAQPFRRRHATTAAAAPIDKRRSYSGGAPSKPEQSFSEIMEDVSKEVGVIG